MSPYDTARSFSAVSDGKVAVKRGRTLDVLCNWHLNPSAFIAMKVSGAIVAAILVTEAHLCELSAVRNKRIERTNGEAHFTQNSTSFGSLFAQ